MKALAQELFSYIDLTTLNATDTFHTVDALIDLAKKNECIDNKVAAICVFPNFGAHVLSGLENSSIKTAVVAGSFPHGQSFLEVKEQEVRLAAELGVHEIDIVLNRGLFFAANYTMVKSEIERLKVASGNAQLKVILESGELKSKENIHLAAQLAIEGGADFVKTSTGKCEVGATFESARIICQELKRHFLETGDKV
jgi:deoxyribose-phosphate aldolase